MRTLSKTTSLLMAGVLAAAAYSGSASADSTVKKETTDSKTPVASKAADVEVKTPAVATKAAEAKAPAVAAASATKASVATAVKDTSDEIIVLDSIEVSQSINSVLSDIHNARLALFEGEEQAAMELVEKANATFKTDAAKSSIKLDGEKNYGIPVNYSIEFSEAFKPSEDNAEVIVKAGNEAKSGNTSGAVKIMTRAGIDLSIKYAMLPSAGTMTKLDKVMADIKGKKFYEANLALKSIETSIFVEDFELTETPKQGYDLKDIS